MTTFRPYSIIFSLVGVILAVAGMVSWKSHRNFINTSQTAEGEVLRLEYQVAKEGDNGVYHPFVSFLAQDGKVVEFVSRVGSSPPSFSQGEKVAVLYDPAKPETAELKDFMSIWLDTVVLGIIAFAFLLFGILFYLIEAIPARRKAYLLKHGQRIETEFNKVELDESLTVNGEHPYRLYSQWRDPASGKLYVFKSESIWYDPEGYISEKIIPVLVDPKNYNKHYMDISFLPERG